MIISKRFTFEASHILPLHDGKCSRLHGHSWSLSISVEGPINEQTGFVADFTKLSELVKTHVIEPLDHTHLGQGQALAGPCGMSEDYSGYIHIAKPYFGPIFYPTSENLCRAIFKLLNPLVKELAHDVRLSEVKIDETCTSSASWRWVDEYAGGVERRGSRGTSSQESVPSKPGSGVHEPGKVA